MRTTWRFRLLLFCVNDTEHRPYPKSIEHNKLTSFSTALISEVFFKLIFSGISKTSMKSSKPWTKPALTWTTPLDLKQKKYSPMKKKRINVLDCVYKLNKRKNYEILIKLTKNQLYSMKLLMTAAVAKHKIQCTIYQQFNFKKFYVFKANWFVASIIEHIINSI